MSKQEQREILFGKEEHQILSRISSWNNDSACLPLEFPKDECEKKAS